jgi:glycosyltransferase involved in cell wall biosynthesis
LQRYQAKDERIRLVLLEKNMGTYGARNIGWLHANGRYLTGQDSDDWSHPRRLELQVRHLDANPQAAGNWCQGIRVNEHLQLDIRDGNFPLRTGDRSVAVSMMIRHSPTFLRLGFFDGVRKAADTEYVQRMKAVFGQDSFGEIAEVLYVIQARYDSLSRTDFAPDWKHPNRQLYATIYSRWHRKITSGKERDYFMPLENTRKFPAPFAFTPAARSNTVREFDEVFLGDWYSESSRQSWLINQIRASIASGKKVGFAHVDGLFKKHARQGKPSSALLELYETGQVDFVALDDKNVTVSKLVTAVEYPVFAEEKESSLSIKTVELVRFDDSLAELTEPSEKNARLIFGVTPEVLEATN